MNNAHAETQAGTPLHLVVWLDHQAGTALRPDP